MGSSPQASNVLQYYTTTPTSSAPMQMSTPTGSNMDPQTLQLLQMLSGNQSIGSGATGAPIMPITPQMQPTPYQATPQLQSQTQNQLSSNIGGLFGLLPGMVQPQQPQQQNPNVWPSPYSPGWAQMERSVMGPISYIQG